MTGWRKPSRSLANGACVEAASWRKATASMGHDEGNCAGTACGPGVVGVRARWQAARYRLQSAMAGPFRRLSLGLAAALAVGAVLALAGALMVILGLVP